MAILRQLSSWQYQVKVASDQKQDQIHLLKG